MLRFLLCCVLLLFQPSLPDAAPAPSEPLLRIETGRHTAVIRRIDVDRSGRWLVSASDDKTVRLWDLRAGALSAPVRIMRPPAGPGNEGRLYSVAISPDGSQVAASGWTQFNQGNSALAADGHAIYLFSRSDGRMVARAEGLPNVINHLAFSHDGRWLAAALGSGGVRVYAVENGGLRLVGQDTRYDKQSNGLHFSPNGKRLVTACYDGLVRLYDLSGLGGGAVQQMQPLAARNAPGGSQPFAVKFSPDGSRVAVGFNEGPRVSVLSAADLAPLYSPRADDLSVGSLGRVAWSVDGRSLYAAGNWQVNGNWVYQVRRWSDAGRGAFRDLQPGVKDTIIDFSPLPDNSMAFGSMDPAIGVFAPDGSLRMLVGPTLADMRQSQNGFPLSYDAATVRFGYTWQDGSPAGFSLHQRTLTQNDSVVAATATGQPDTTSLPVTGWKYGYHPAVDGRALKLLPFETSMSLAVAPGKGSLLLGTDWRLRCFDKNGVQLWETITPGTAWNVNISGDGRLAVVAFGDGTIRWYRYTDGKELLTLFPHADKRRWVLWTPSGYYDASPGAEELVGWLVNNGKQQAADFFPASRFRATYHRPDVIDRILDTLDEGAALQQANAESTRKRQEVSVAQALPPVVTIVSPADGATVASERVKLRYRVRTPSGEPVTGIKVLVDGRPVAQERGLAAVSKAQGDERELTVTLTAADSMVSLIAENRYSASEPATVRLLRPVARTQQKEFVVQPKLYVLAIGVSAYQQSDLRLKFAAKDARDFGAAMQRQKGGLYRDVSVKVLTDVQATRDNIMDALEWLQQETTAKDVAMLFLAGHGVNDPSGIYHFLPVNADPERLKRTAVPFSDLKNTVASLAGKALMFVDTCHSGNVLGTRRGATDIGAVVNELSSAENGVVVFASSTGRQYSLEDPRWGNGAFTKALVEGLSGRADYGGKGKITINMLDLYLSERVKELTGGKQTPTTTKPQTVQDFPLAVRR